MMSKADYALVYAVDQMLDFYELNKKPMPSAISVTQKTYDALLAYESENKSIKLMQLTHYRKVPIRIIKANNRT